MEKTTNRPVKVGERVGCFLSIVGDTALFLGFGVYVGDEVPPNDGRKSLTEFLAGERRSNPKIVLDSGDIVWGCECWWGPEDEVKDQLTKLKVKNVSIVEALRGEIPSGFEEHWGPGAPMGDFLGGADDGGDKNFWS
jgi:hypothetical protein